MLFESQGISHYISHKVVHSTILDKKKILSPISPKLFGVKQLVDLNSVRKIRGKKTTKNI